MKNETPIIAGTEYFISRTAAIQYYAAYDYSANDVDNKIKTKEIHIGKPFLKANQKAVVKDSRYWIESESN